MNWTEQIDAYCERMDASYWAEPINAVTNIAFILAALFMWRRSAGLPLAQALCVVLFAIGVGSFLFHTHATGWAAMTDVVPSVAYILLYIYVANRAFLGLGLWGALGGVALFIPYAGMMVPAFSLIPGLGSSAGYAPVPLLIYFYALWLKDRAPETAKGLAIGATILVVSLTFRTIDLPLCDGFPMGTHFMWHILNGIMLAWMIEVYRRHVLGIAQEAR